MAQKYTPQELELFVWQLQYAHTKHDGVPETTRDGFRRVAKHVATKSGFYGSDVLERVIEEYADAMEDHRMCPGGRVLAGSIADYSPSDHGNLLNCFVQDTSPHEPGTDAGVLALSRKLAHVTRVGGGNGLCLDEYKPKRAYTHLGGHLYITIARDHPDYEKVSKGIYKDLVHNKYVEHTYKFARFVEPETAPIAYEVVTCEDSIDGIWDSAEVVVKQLLAGESVLVDLSNLREEGAPVKGSGGTSSGPSSFAVEIFDNFGFWASLGGAEYAGPVATLRYVFSPTLRVIRQGGSRRGAGMATISQSHEDVLDFLTCKDTDRELNEGRIDTFNISVLVEDAFMNLALLHARHADQGNEDSAAAYELLNAIADHAWQTGEPGVIFIDAVNDPNPLRETKGPIKATNPLILAA